NLLFHGLDTLDSERFHRLGTSENPSLRVELNGPEESIIEQVSGLLSTFIKNVEIIALNFTADDFSICEKVLSGSTIDFLSVMNVRLVDSSASNIVSMASHSNRLLLDLHDDQI
ncbi:hypothetical protein PMAYCL1PPCAC_27183, partial [Pristionchus mayeri]